MEKIIILLSTYNGELYIKEQLDSLINQQGVDIHIVVRDDGSSDNTVDIIGNFIAEYPDRITLIKGKNMGVAKSFLWLMEYAYHLPNCKYFAFCDQDDVWKDNKLKIAVERLSGSAADKPALFFSYYQLVDSLGNEMPTVHPELKLTLGETLVMNSSVGCTQVFNRTLLKYALKNAIPTKILHDWWIYVVCQALQGDVYYEKTPLIYYRQHGHNVLGGKSISKLRKLWNWLFYKNERLNSSLAQAVLNGYQSEISKYQNSVFCLNILTLAANSPMSFWCRMKLLACFPQFKTYNTDVNYGFMLSVLFGKF